MTHALKRTSPRGKGQKFIGICTKCGQRDLRPSAVFEDCPADGVVSDTQALLEAVDPTPEEDDNA